MDQNFGILTSTVILVLLAWRTQYIWWRKKLSVPVIKLGNNKMMEVLANGKNTVEATARKMVRYLLKASSSILTSHSLWMF